MNYELRQYDYVLLKFSLERRSLDEFIYNITWVNEELKCLLPIGLQLDSKGLSKWLSSRTVPKNREFVDQILSKSGLSHNDTIGIINLSKGLSLNDSYWIVEEGFKGKFLNYKIMIFCFPCKDY